jgi:6-phosphogluconolactonase (cycloisomerase 2 family)
MKKLLSLLAALAIAFFGSEASRIIAAPGVPFELIVPYFTVAGDVRSSKSVSVYRIDGSSGTVTRISGSPSAAGPDPGVAALAPGGRFAYVVNNGSHTISAFDVDAMTGALGPVVGSPFPLDYSPSGYREITVAPSGKFAYVASDAGISAFSIDGTTGALSAVPGSPFATVRSDGFGTTSIAVAPSERFAYVVNHAANTVSTFAIEATGALERAGSPLDAGQNSNDLQSFGLARIDPKGKFLYVTGRTWVYVYAIDEATGALAPPAHVSLGIGDNALRGFAIDPTGRFAYAIDDGRIYSYAIDATTGTLKAVAGRRFVLGTGTYPDTMTIDPTGRFAYVFAPGSRTIAPSISGYRIDPSTGELTPLARSPFAVAADTSDPIHRWFNAGRCAAFDGELGADTAPLAKRDSQGVIFDRVTASTRGYFYDPKTRRALHYPNTDSAGTFTLRVSAPPPAGVPQHDLSKLRTASGLTLGSRVETVVATLGKPKIVTGCGLERYVYLRSRDGEPTSLQFTIEHGRVTEIFEDFGG